MPTIRGMDIWNFISVSAAVIFGNAASFAFFMGAMKCSQLQKTGVKDDELPWWVYACLLAPGPFVIGGVMLLN